MTYIQRELEDMAWALLYGFKLTQPTMQGWLGSLCIRLCTRFI